MDFAVTAAALVGGGIGTIMLANSHLDSWGWIVMLPVWLALLYMFLGT